MTDSAPGGDTAEERPYPYAETVLETVGRDITSAFLHLDQALKRYREVVDPEHPAYNADYAASWSGQALDHLLFNGVMSLHSIVLTHRHACKPSLQLAEHEVDTRPCEASPERP